MYAFWSFAYNIVFDFLSVIYIPIISDQSKSNTLYTEDKILSLILIISD